jgi:endogenous inhibitor of DNA gyrase (YacG/DUF329 family)
MKPNPQVPCPTCKEKGDWFAGAYGCKLVDLGKWFSGENKISEPLRPEQMEDIEGISEEKRNGSEE